MIKTVRYLFAGGLGASLNFLIYFILLSVFNFWYLIASIISFSLSTIASFYFQKYLTFRNLSKDNIKKQVFMFFIFAIINLLINVILMVFFVEILTVNKILAKVFTLGIIAIWSFFVYQRIIFK